MTLDSVITARRDHIPVYLRHKGTGQLVKRLGIPAKNLANILSESEGFQKVSECAVKRETRGVVRLVYGAEQVIDLKTVPLSLDTADNQNEQKDYYKSAAGVATSTDKQRSIIS
jgi:hypothetical protein